MCFNFNKKNNNLGIPQPFRIKSGQNAEISHTNQIIPRRFQGTF